ncbi:MAG: DUF4307 domain-containing protein [Nocardioidaceae bacterium]
MPVPPTDAEPAGDASTSPGDPPGFDQRAYLEERYGRPDPRRRAAWVVGTAMIAVAGIGWVVWAALGQATGVSSQLVGFRIPSEHRTVVTISVTRDTGDGVHCEVYAEASDHSVVGERSVDLAPGHPGTRTITAVIATERQAVAGILRSCVVAPNHQ